MGTTFFTNERMNVALSVSKCCEWPKTAGEYTEAQVSQLKGTVSSIVRTSHTPSRSEPAASKRQKPNCLLTSGNSAFTNL